MTQAINFVTEVLRNKSLPMDIAIRHITESFRFSNEFSIHGFENLCKIEKLISRSLEIQIKFKDFSTQQKRTLFLYEAPGQPINEFPNN